MDLETLLTYLDFEFEHSNLLASVVLPQSNGKSLTEDAPTVDYLQLFPSQGLILCTHHEGITEMTCIDMPDPLSGRHIMTKTGDGGMDSNELYAESVLDVISHRLSEPQLESRNHASKAL